MGGNEIHYDNPHREPSLKPGDAISHYTIVSHLGSGGMSEVYLAEDSSLNRTVALKFLLPDLAADPEFRRRFQKEATGMASVNHPNVAVIYETAEFRDRPFFAMEYVGGRSLEEIIQEGPVPPQEGIGIAIQICDGLAAIHGKDLIHRDIKPSNILVEDNGRAHILDFGIVHVSGQAPGLRPESMAGTLWYLSPEQITGEPLRPASDLFSLGILLYYMLTGTRPFEGSYEASLKYAIVNQEPTPVSERRAGIPRDLSSIIMKLLEKDPAARYQDASEVAAALRNLTPEGHGAPSDIAPPRPRMNVALRMVPLILVLGAIVIIVAIVGFPGGEHPASPATLAVLPFKNLGAPEDEYFSEGITDAIITRLATIEGLRVISRGSSILYKDSDLGFREIGAELGTGYLLTGSVFWDRSAGPEEVQINTQLVRVSDESYVWGETFQHNREKILSLQADIAERVTGVLKIALSEADRRSMMAVPTANLDAYDYFLRGSHYFNRSWDQNDILNATEMFQHAVDIDTAFALAYAMLSRGHESMYWEYYDRSQNRCQLARQAAEKSLALQPGLIEGHLALGYIYYHCEQNYDRALAEFRQALASQPNHADLYSAVAAVQRRQGKLAEAVENFKEALALDPRSHLKAFDVALTYGMMRRYDETMRYLDKTLALAPDVALPYVYKAWCHIFYSGDTASAKEVLETASGRADIASSRYYWWLARIVEPDFRKALDESRLGPDTTGYLLHRAQLYRLLDLPDQERIYADSARRLLEVKVRDYPDDPRFHSQLGLAYAGLRQKPEALAHGQKAVELLPASRDAFDALFLVINLAETMVIFGEYDAALDQLEYLMSIPGFVSVPYLQLDPVWKPLRALPRFQKMIGKT